mgnify:CR=1 FL=1
MEKCKRCNYEWNPRLEKIKICPNCKSKYWDKEKSKISLKEENIFNNPSYTSILLILVPFPLTQEDLAKHCNISQPAISKKIRNLMVLKYITVDHKRLKKVYYTIETDKLISDILTMLKDTLRDKFKIQIEELSKPLLDRFYWLNKNLVNKKRSKIIEKSKRNLFKLDKIDFEKIKIDIHGDVFDFFRNIPILYPNITSFPIKEIYHSFILNSINNISIRNEDFKWACKLYKEII